MKQFTTKHTRWLFIFPWSFKLSMTVENVWNESNGLTTFMSVKTSLTTGLWIIYNWGWQAERHAHESKWWDTAVSYLMQLSQLVGVQEQLLQTAVVAVNLIGHRSERAVPLIHGLDVTVTPPQRDTLQHVPEHSAPPHRGLTQAAKRWETGWYRRFVTPWTLSTQNSQIKALARTVLLQMSTNSSDDRGQPEDHTQAELLSTFTVWFNVS